MNSKLKCGAPDTQIILIIFLSVIAVMQMIFGTEANFCFISDCRNSFNWKLKKLVSKQIIIFYSLSNALWSSEKSVQIKLYSITLSLVCVPLLLGSICKYWISVNEDTSGLELIKQICQCAVSWKPGAFILPLIHNWN